MNPVFSPRLDILSRPQRRLWRELSSLPPAFVLYGGTAVALHLGHRQSMDFDFFGNRPLDPANLIPAIPFLSDARAIQREPNILSFLVNRGGDVKVSFFGLPGLPRLLPPVIAADNGLQIASLLDLAGTKVSIIQMRAEAKEHIDIDAILADGRIDLPMALSAGQLLYGDQFDPLSALKALTYFEDGNGHRLSAALKRRLAGAARAVDPGRLPVIAIHNARPAH